MERKSSWERALDTIKEWALAREFPDHPGLYCRKDGLGPEVYGTSDLICILFTLGELPRDRRTLSRWANGIRSCQDPETGKFAALYGPDHSIYHEAAFPLAALEIIDELPAYPVKFMEELRDWDRFLEWVEQRQWELPYAGAGLDIPAVASSFAILGSTGPEWFHSLFNWLDAEQDPNTGYWRRGMMSNDLRNHLGASFHFYFVYEHFQRPILRSRNIFETTLSLMDDSGLWHRDWHGGWPPSYLDFDGVYVLARTSRAEPALRRECESAFRKTIQTVDAHLSTSEGVEALCLDLHETLAAVTLLSVLQEVCPDLVPVRRRLRNVLDRRPFI